MTATISAGPTTTTETTASTDLTTTANDDVPATARPAETVGVRHTLSALFCSYSSTWTCSACSDPTSGRRSQPGR